MSILKLRPIDAGFDARKTGHKIVVPDDATSAEILKNGDEPHILEGTAEFIREHLPRYGYAVDGTGKFTIDRTGELPLRFTGFEIGSGSTRTSSGDSSNRWTSVRIWRTKGGKYVVRAGNYTCWQGEQDHIRGASFATPAEVIDWLRSDNDGRLGRASQEACEEAANNDAEFAKAFVEEVD